MVIAILADHERRKELLQKGFDESVEVLWADSLSSLIMIEADAWFDFNFDENPERLTILRGLVERNSGTKPVFINAVTATLASLGIPGAIRINGWPGMIDRSLTELVFDQQVSGEQVEQIMKTLGWAYKAVPDIPGFITPRIIASIINEAFFLAGEGVSSKEDIDLAMKTGTNYPFGPFEWTEKIGPGQILALLKSMNYENARYEIAPLLISIVSNA